MWFVWFVDISSCWLSASLRDRQQHTGLTSLNSRLRGDGRKWGMRHPIRQLRPPQTFTSVNIPVFFSTWVWNCCLMMALILASMASRSLASMAFT